MDELENLFLEKYETLKKVSVPWKEIFETAQKLEKKLSIDEARQEGYTRHVQARSLLTSMSKSELVTVAIDFLFDLRKKEWANKSLRVQVGLSVTQRELIRRRLSDMKTKLSERGAKAAEIRHDKPGGSRSKADEIRRLWASGNYSSRSLCAEQECASLNMSYDTARRALRNTPKPPSRCSA